MLMFNVMKYSDNYSELSGIVWQYFRDEAVLDHDCAFGDVYAANATTNLFKIKDIITRQTVSNARNIEIMVPLTYVNIFWRTLEMPLIN